MHNYIDVPIETDPEVLAADSFDFIQGTFPDWVPNDGNLETVLVEALARMTAEARDVASAVPTEIFKYFGQLVGILPQEATSATATTDWTMINNAGYTIPALTQVGIRTAGDVLVPFVTSLEVVVAAGNTTALNVPIHAVVPGEDSSGLTGTVELIDNLDFVTGITIDTPGTTGGLDAEDEDEYLSRLSARLQLLAPRPILPVDFAVFAQDIQGVERAIAFDGYNPQHNFLTANQSSIETDASGWAVNTNCTIVRSTAFSAHGSASLALTSSASGSMSANTAPTTTVPCVPGEYFTAIGDFRAAASARSVRVELQWFTSAPAFISTTSGVNVTDTTTGWTQASVSGSAPATAAYVRVVAVVISTGAASEVHYVDRIAIRHGSDLTWTIGGTAETNNERMVTVAVADGDGQPVGSTVKTEVDDYLQDHREVNFVVWIIDPTYTTIDVTFTVKAKPGNTAADVEAATEAAVTNYLSPKNWGVPQEGTDDILTAEWTTEPIVRYLELAQVINEVGGVDYVSSLTLRKGSDSFASADVILNGIAPLPQPGTISATVT